MLADDKGTRIYSTRSCPHCGRVDFANAKFCSGCGHELAEQTRGGFDEDGVKEELRELKEIYRGVFKRASAGDPKPGYSLRIWEPFNDFGRLERTAKQVGELYGSRPEIEGRLKLLRRDLKDLDTQSIHDEWSRAKKELDECTKRVDFYYKSGRLTEFYREKHKFDAMEIEFRNYLFPMAEDFNNDVKKFIQSVLNFCEFLEKKVSR